MLQAIREQLDAPKTVVLDPKQLLCRAGMDETQRIYILPALFYAWTCVGPHSFLSQGTDADRWARAFLTAMLDDATEDVQRNDNFNDLRTYLRRLAELTPINAFEGVDPVTNTTMLLWSELVAFNEVQRSYFSENTNAMLICVACRWWMCCMWSERKQTRPTSA